MPAPRPVYGAVLLTAAARNLLAGVQGVALLAVGLCARCPGCCAWDADAELAARAQALTQRVDRLTETRSDATETAVAELRRIERDLHDGAQARLVAVGMSLRAAEQLMPRQPRGRAAPWSREARETSSRALDDLRGLVRGIYPPVLADRGLADAVRALALDAPLTVDTDITLSGGAAHAGRGGGLLRHRGSPDERGAALRGRHGRDRHRPRRRPAPGDDRRRRRRAAPTRAAGTGLSGVERRLATFDGILAVSSPPGGPTIVVIEVPCELSNTGASRSTALLVAGQRHCSDR